MKLTTFLLIICLVHVSAKSLSQITLNSKNVPLEKVLKSIKQQTGYTFIYESDVLQERSVSVNVSNASLATTLSQCLKDMGLTYKVIDKNVVIQVQSKPLINKIGNLFQSSDIRVSGKVVDEKGSPLPNATIKIKGETTTIPVTTGESGGFSLIVPGAQAVLVVSYVGYKTKEVTVSGADVDLTIRLEPAVGELQQVVVSTGYQEIPKERATGSFETLSAKQLNQVTSPDILSRLIGNTVSMNFNPQLAPTSSGNPIKQSLLADITIRGSNSLVGNQSVVNGTFPLVVVDGVAVADDGAGQNYSVDEDPVSKINPNDVESITILKDAAAASIWGARAANGVIVITTKKGKYNEAMQVTFNSNVSVTEKPDLFYYKRASTDDYIGMQKYLYSQGYYDGTLSYQDYAQYNYPQLSVPQVVEILEQQKNGQITADQANAQFAAMGKNDVRNDVTKYLLRNAVKQQYSLSLSGGSQNVSYRLAGGYDHGLNNTVTSHDDRLTLSSSTTVKPVKNLDLQANITYMKFNRQDQSTNSYLNESGNVNIYAGVLDPYTRLVDANGNPAVVIKDIRPGYRDTVGHGNLLNWQYVPLNDIHDGYYKTDQSKVTINLQGHYRLNDIFRLGVIYDYQKMNTDITNVDEADGYFARNLVNLYTSPPDYINPSTGSPQPYHRSLPAGGVYSPYVDNLTAQDLRAQLDIDKTWKKNNINAIAGVELRDSYATFSNNVYWGYNSATKQYNSQLDYLRTDIPYFWYGSMAQIPYTSFFDDSKLRQLSEYVNASYTYDNRYTVTASARRDGSNVFGVATNKSFNPFYSVGGLWNISNEKFYKLDWLPTLHARATFGYNGNLNYSISPLAYYSATNGVGANGLQYAYLYGAANNQLQPERSGQLNIGLDFGFKNNRLTGTIEYFNKDDKKLLNDAPVDPTTSFTDVDYNSADMKVHGVELTLNSINIKRGTFTWNSTFMFRYNQSKITQVYTETLSDVNAYSILLGTNLKGYSLNSVWAYKWAGLSNTGAPQIYYDGKVSTDYSDAAFTSNRSAIKYVGSRTPLYAGSFRNTFTYGNFLLSANLTYSFDYYFRRPDAISYSNIANGNRYLPAEYAQRWQKPGDEAHTNVPAFTYPTNSTADMIYYYSTINVLKGDNIRVQELNLSYTFKTKAIGIKNLRIYGDIQNLGIIWRANKQGYDPDVYDIPIPRTYALGLTASF